MGYYGRSLQDIMGAGYEEPQPEFGIADAMGQIPPSAYSTLAAEDDQFVPAATDAISRMIQPQDPRAGQLPDMAYGRASSFERGNQGIPNDEATAMEVAGAIIKLPFGLLNEGRNLIQDTLGLPGAQQRQRARDEMEMLKNLPQWQRQQLGIDQISGFQTPSSQPSDASGTAGAPSSLGQGGQSTMKGAVEWVNNLGRDRAQQQLSQVMFAIKANVAAGRMSQMDAELALTQARERLTGRQAEGQEWDNLQGYKYDDRDRQLGQGESIARAGASNASAYASTMHGNQARDLTPHLVNKAKGEAQGVYDANWRNMDQYTGVSRPSGDLALKQMREKGVRDNQGFSIWAQMQADEERRKEAESAAQLRATDAYTAKQGETGGPRLDALMRSDLGYRKEYSDLVDGSGKQPGIDPLEAAKRLGIPLKTNDGWLWDSQEPDLGKWDPAGLRTRGEVPVAQGDGVATTESPVRPDGATVNAMYRLLKGADPAGNEGTLMARAQELAKISPQLDRSTQDAFLDSAEKFGLSDSEIIALWNGQR